MSIQDCKQDMLRIGVDVGSTTVKLLVLDPDDQIVFSVYRRHHSDVRATIVEIIDEALEAVGDGKATITIILTSGATRSWPSASAGCWASTSRRTSAARIWR